MSGVARLAALVLMWPVALLSDLWLGNALPGRDVQHSVELDIRSDVAAQITCRRRWPRAREVRGVDIRTQC